MVADRHRPGRRRPRQGRRLRCGITAGGRVGISRHLLGGGWAVPAGARTSTTPSRWPETATRQPSPLSSPGPTVCDAVTGCFGPMTPRCARSRRRCRPPKGSSNDVALSVAEYALGGALLSRDAAADRRRGLELMVQVRDSWLRERAPFLVPVAELWVARERARRGDRDAAIAVMRQAVDELHQAGRPFFGVWGTGVLVETLLERGAEGDLAEAQEAIDRLANLSADQGSAMREIYAAAAARAAIPRPRRRDGLPGPGGALSRDGAVAWLRGTHRVGRGDGRGWGIAGQGMRRARSTSSAVVVGLEHSGFRRRASYPKAG